MEKALTVEQFSAKVAELMQAARVEFPVINAKVAQTALSLIKDRIIKTGTKADGSSFGKYSTNPLPSFFFIGKGISGGVDAKLQAELKRQRKAGIKNPAITYETWRSLNNLQTDHMDFKFSGDTMKDIAVLETTVQGDIVTTTVASKDSISKSTGSKKKPTITTGEVLEHLAEKHGDLLAVSKSEEETLLEVYESEIEHLFNSIFTR